MSSHTLSIVIPCYNEKKTLLNMLARVEAASVDLTKEIILIDDGSTDGTRELMDGLRDRYTVIFHEKNRGKGAALRTGFKAAHGDFVIIQDADLEYNPTDYPKLLAPLISGVADVVYGSRFSGSGPHRVLYFWHQIGNQTLTLISNAFTNLNLTDMETGYKVFRREILLPLLPHLKADRFGFEPEITAWIAHRTLRVYEVGISYQGRTYEEGKKIGWWDGVKAIFAIVYCNIQSTAAARHTRTTT